MCAGSEFALPFYDRITRGYDRWHTRFFEGKMFGSAGLDAGVDIASIVLGFNGNLVGAVALKLSYNLACAVGPDALRSIRERFHINPAQ